MCANDLIPDFDEIFDNETSDINSDFLQDDHLLWGDDVLNSHEFSFDQLNDNLYDNLNEKDKGRLLDFDCHLADFSHLLKYSYENQEVKIEPTNSVSSTYLTDESSHTSSANSSPVSIKVRKRNFATLDSCSDHSIPLHDERVEHPAKTTKVEFVKSTLPAKIYKLTKDVKSEPIYINSVSIRQNNSSLPYVVHKLPSGIKTVNILSQKYPTERAVDLICNNNNSIPCNSQQMIPDEDQEFLTGDLYNSEVDRYSDFRARPQNYHSQSAYGYISQSNINKTVFQSIPQVGPFHLTEEEKRTLLAEGYSIPTRLPLTKQDERNLKKIRRKIKNKISAQESRRKKKEYVDTLEKKMESYEVERVESKRRFELLENTQRSLYNQIKHLQQQLINKVAGSDSTTSTGLMLFMMCFSLLLVGGTMSSSYNFINGPQSRLESSSSFYHMGYGTSRSIFNYTDQTNMFQNNWHYKIDDVNYQSFTDDGIIRHGNL